MVFVELPSLIPRESGLRGKYAAVWLCARGYVRGNVNSSVCTFFLIFYNLKCNYSIHNWWGISFRFLAQFHYASR